MQLFESNALSNCLDIIPCIPLTKNDPTLGSLDYVYEGHVILLQPEDEVHLVNITIIDDEILEATEIFTAKLRVLSNQVGINVVNGTLPVSILDNDCELHN